MHDIDPATSATIAVHRGDWDLPPEIAAMVAPPITVTAMPAGREPGPQRKAQLARSRGNMPVARHRRAAR